MKTLPMIALSLATAMSSIPAAGAFPIAPQMSRTSDVQKAQFQNERGEDRKNRSSCAVPYCELQGRRDSYRDRDYRDRHGYYRDGYYRDGYYRDGYYRDGYYRDRYRHHNNNDAGAFIGGLAAGAIVGGLINQPRYYNGPRAASGDAHARWCYARYRSYRAWDNSYQPYGGPRRQCSSPY